MPLKTILEIVLIFTATIVQAKEISGFVLSKKSLEPIKYANVKIENLNKGTYVNEQGMFGLEVKQTDIITISCIGFKTYRFSVDKFNIGDTVYLTPVEYTLPDVVVINKSNTEEVGYLKEKTKLYHAFPAYNWGTECVCFINNSSNKTAKVLSVIFDAKKGEAESVIRLHIYKPLNSGEPGEELLQEDVLLYSADISNGKLIADVSDHNIIYNSKGLFVGLELIGYQRYDVIKNDLNNKHNSIIQIGLTKADNSKCYTKFIFDESAQWERVYNSKATIENFGAPLSYKVGLSVQNL